MTPPADERNVAREHAADDLVDQMAREVGWYRRCGKYPRERIARDAGGNEYVEGDRSWNSKRENPDEYIEPEMNRALGRSQA